MEPGAGATQGAKEAEPAYSTAGDRTFFIVDLTRLERETDTLENATVVYRPEADLKRVCNPVDKTYQWQSCPKGVGVFLKHGI